MVLSERTEEDVPVIMVLPGNIRNLRLILLLFLSFLYDHWQVVLDEDYHNNVKAEVVPTPSSSFPLLITVTFLLKLGKKFFCTLVCFPEYSGYKILGSWVDK